MARVQKFPILKYGNSTEIPGELICHGFAPGSVPELEKYQTRSISAVILYEDGSAAQL